MGRGGVVALNPQLKLSKDYKDVFGLVTLSSPTNRLTSFVREKSVTHPKTSAQEATTTANLSFNFVTKHATYAVTSSEVRPFEEIQSKSLEGQSRSANNIYNSVFD